MPKDFIPSEYFEAQDRKVKHDKGREEAKFYRFFLEAFHKKVMAKVLKETPPDSQSMKSGDNNVSLIGFGVTMSDLDQYFKEAFAEARRDNGDIPQRNLSVDLEKIAKMSPIEFGFYINRLEASLIK